MTRSQWLPFSSFSLMSEFSPAVGAERWHCDMRRGYQRVRKKEPQIASLLSEDTTPQRIGLLAQQAVYELHYRPELLSDEEGITQIAEILNLAGEELVVQDRLISVIQNYIQNPILRERNVLHLSKGDEGFPTPIEVHSKSFWFNLFAALDCSFLEPDGTVHILDFKTGKSDFDPRQGYVYLLAAQHLYPNQKAIASFYNLESCRWSEPLTATDPQLSAVRTKLARIARKHEYQRQSFKEAPSQFEHIFPPSPSRIKCRNCQFHSICPSSEWQGLD